MALLAKKLLNNNDFDVYKYNLMKFDNNFVVPENVKFVNISDTEFFKLKVLFKIMSFTRSIEVLTNKKFWFSNPIRWLDPYEKMFVNATYKSKQGEFLFPWHNRVCCFCLTENASSQASWCTYCENQIGMQFCINVEQLFNEICREFKNYKIFIGRVEYMSTRDFCGSISKIPFQSPCPNIDLNDDSLLARLMFLKRNAFEFEKEIRIVVVKNEEEKDLNGIHFSYNCDNTELIQSIVIDPMVNDDCFNTISDFIVTQFNFIPINNYPRVRHSRLYKDILKTKQI